MDTIFLAVSSAAGFASSPYASYAGALFIAAAAGIVLLTARGLYLRRAAGDAPPAPGSAFAGYGVSLRLRDLFRLAVMIEEQGKDFYKRLEARAAAPETKQLCAWLAGEEEKHRHFVQDHLNKWRLLPPHRTEWPAFLEKVKQEGFFAGPPPDSASEEELASYAIGQEAKSAEFYRNFEAAFPEAWKRERLHRLVKEELSHEARLRAAYPKIK